MKSHDLSIHETPWVNLKGIMLSGEKNPQVPKGYMLYDSIYRASCRRQDQSDGEEVHGCPGLGAGHRCDCEGQYQEILGDRMVLFPDCVVLVT